VGGGPYFTRRVVGLAWALTALALPLTGCGLVGYDDYLTADASRPDAGKRDAAAPDTGARDAARDGTTGHDGGNVHGDASRDAKSPADANAHPITEIELPPATSSPNAIVAGPDGALWFTEGSENAIGHVTTAGVISHYPLAMTVGPAVETVVGPDGALWFTGSEANIGRITSAGVVTSFPVPTAGSEPMGITAGPDGALWFTEYVGNGIGQITTAGVVTEFPLPTANAFPASIVAGPDGALWFTENSTNNIGPITTTRQPSNEATNDSDSRAGPSRG
jgi:streptogramin lyase